MDLMVMFMILVSIMMLFQTLQKFNIDNYLMKKNNSVIKCLGLLKKCSFYKISVFINFNEHKFVELYFNEQ